MAARWHQNSIDEVEAAIVYWDPIAQLARVVNGTNRYPSPNLDGAADFEFDHIPVSQGAINETINAAREHLHEILNGEMPLGLSPGNGSFDGDYSDDDIESEVDSDASDEEEGQEYGDETESGSDDDEGEDNDEDYDENDDETDDGNNEDYDDSYEDEAMTESEDEEHEDEAMPEDELQGLAEEELEEAETIVGEDAQHNEDDFSSNDGNKSDERHKSWDDNLSDCTETMRTGQLRTYIRQVDTYGPDDKSSVQVILRFRAPLERTIITFNVDRYDCDTLNVELHKYDGGFGRYTQPVGAESYTVDVDLSELHYVEEIKTVGVYLAKRNKIAALILSYVFDDDDEEEEDANHE